MPPSLTLERKQLPLLDFALTGEGAGTFIGLASTYEVDSYGDQVMPGAYADTLPKFLQDGFVAWGHDDRIPVAYPTRAYEDDRGLWVEAAFHGTPEAQQARQIAVERQAAGKRTGLSIGYYTKRAEMGSDGIRRLLAVDLVEVSLVMSPAADNARVSGVKASDTELKPFENEHACRLADPSQYDRFRRANGDREHEGKRYDVIYGHVRDGDTWEAQAFRYPRDTWSAEAARSHCASHDGTFEAASEAAGKGGCRCITPDDWLDYDTHAAQIQDFIDRTRQGAEKRVKEGRAISTARRARMATVSGELRKAADEIDAMLAETAPPERDKAAGYDPRLALALRVARLRRHGVHLESAPCP